MKKILIGAFVGGIILFVWQFLSWDLLNLHRTAYQYTDRQDSLLQYLSTQFHEDGQYILPGVKPGATMQEQEAAMKAAIGKPWAVVAWHASMQDNMVSNMVRGVAVNFVLMILFCWLLMRFKEPGFSTIFVASLFTGMIIFLDAPYTLHIWFGTPGIMADFWDAIIGWAAAGLWLGWYMKKKAA